LLASVVQGGTDDPPPLADRDSILSETSGNEQLLRRQDVACPHPDRSGRSLVPVPAPPVRQELLLDTIRCLFEGHEALFDGLDIHEHWDWTATPHPVLRLSFGGKYNEPEDIERNVLAQLEAIERNAGLPASSSATGPERLLDLLDRLHVAKGQRVVVLVDEYDKPILDVLHDPELATANRDYLRGFYGIIKDSAEHVRFVFVAGVSMFSKVSLFSGLNNLEDISLNPHFAAICGYTDNDIDRVFAPELEGLDRDEMRRRYNGYSWRGEHRVYNPYDILLLMRSREFRPYWFETGSPNFLFRQLMEKSVSPMELEDRMADMSLVSRFDVGNIDIEALLFQTGYLTIAEEHRQGHRTFCRLDYPNLEVELSLNDALMAWLGKKGPEPQERGQELCALLATGDFAGFAEKLRAWLSGIPYQWHATGDLARYEAWHASLLYMCLRAAGVQLRVEDASSHGRADIVVETGGQIFVIELKMAESEGGSGAALDAAVSQIRDRGYADKYRGCGKPVYLVAVACGREARTVLEVRAEPARRAGRCAPA